MIFCSNTKYTLRNGKSTLVVLFHFVFVERERFPDLIIILAKIELNILFIHNITHASNITCTAFNIVLNDLLYRAGTAVVLFDVIFSTNYNISVPDSLSMKMLSVKF